MIAALVPVKALSQAKARLAPLLDAGQRRALSLAMLRDVLAALGASAGLDAVAVTSRDRAVLALAADLGAIAILEPEACRGLNAAIAHAAATLRRQGASAVLVVPADVPAATPSELASLVASVDGRPQVVLSPSASGGTNALLLSPADVIPLRFGPASAEAHRRQAQARRVPFRLMPLASLALDIDTPEDLRRFLELRLDGHTYRCLQEMGLIGLLKERPQEVG